MKFIEESAAVFWQTKTLKRIACESHLQHRRQWGSCHISMRVLHLIKVKLSEIVVKNFYYCSVKIVLKSHEHVPRVDKTLLLNAYIDSLIISPVSYLVVSLEGRAMHLATLVQEAEQRVLELQAQVRNEGPGEREGSDRERQLKAWEWRLRLFRRMQTGFEHASKNVFSKGFSGSWWKLLRLYFWCFIISHTHLRWWASRWVS